MVDMRTLVVGAGAVGGYFGARLVESGADVEFLVRGGRLDQVRSGGIRIAAADGTTSSLAVPTVTADTLAARFDVVLLATKSTAVPGAIADLAPAVDERTAILPLLNGIGHIAALQEAFGTQRVLGGVGFVATELQPDGLIRQIASGASISFGEFDGGITARVEAIGDLLAGAAFDSRVSSTIEQDMWEKWFFMAAGGAATVLLGGSAGAVSAVDGGLELVERIIAESAAVLDAEGHRARNGALDRVTGALTTPGSPFATSLFRDLRAGRRTEVEPVLGDLHRRAVAHGIPTPLLAAATVRLRVHERALDAAAS